MKRDGLSPETMSFVLTEQMYGKRRSISGLSALGFILTMFLVSAYSQIYAPDQRSLKGKINRENNSPIVVGLFPDKGFRFDGKLLSSVELSKKLDALWDTRALEDRIVYVIADPGVQFSRLVELMQMGRILEEDDFSLSGAAKEANFDPAAAVAVKIVLEEPEKVRPKPGSRFLGVELSPAGVISLNGKAHTDTSLVASLKQVFKYRARKRIFRGGSREVEKTVFVRVNLSTTYEALLRILGTVRSSGADPIGIEIDWLKP